LRDPARWDGALDGKWRLVEGRLLDRRRCRRSFERNERTGAEAKNVARAGVRNDGLNVLDLALNTEPVACRTAQTSSASIGQGDGECFGERLAKLQKILGRFHAAVQKQQSWTMSDVAVTDARSILGRH